MTDAKHARGKTIVVVDGKLSKANWKSMDDEWPSEINRSNKPIALFIQKIIVNTNKKKTKFNDNCLNMYWSSFCTDKIPSIIVLKDLYYLINSENSLIIVWYLLCVDTLEYSLN